MNGEAVDRDVEARRALSDFLREDLGLTGTHVGCEHGVCGACTVILDGHVIKSCLMLAAQADGCEITTIEGIERDAGDLHPLQDAFVEAYAAQCGYCTPGMILTSYDLLSRNPDPTEHEIRKAIGGNLCMCTGYVTIVRAIALAARGNRADG